MTPVPKPTTKPKTPKKLKREGVSSVRWRSWRTKQKKLVVLRANGRCEFHGLIESHLEWHHPFGREDEPWSSHYLITTMVCSWTHRMAHSDTQIRDALRWAALKRFMQYNEFELTAAMYTWEAKALFNYTIHNLKKQGASPDGPPNSP